MTCPNTYSMFQKAYAASLRSYKWPEVGPRKRRLPRRVAPLCISRQAHRRGADMGQDEHKNQTLPADGVPGIEVDEFWQAEFARTGNPLYVLEALNSFRA